MEKLTTEQQTAINKMSSLKLMQKLASCGVGEDELDKMDRAGMKNLWAKLVSEGKDKPHPAAAAAVPAAFAPSYDVELEREKFEFEKQRWKADRELEAKKLETDRELEMKRLELEERRMAEEKAAREEAERVRRIERAEDEKRRREKDEAERERFDSPIYKAKLFSDGMKGLLYPQPSDIAALVCYFENVERLFKEFNVDANLQVHLLKPHLSEKGRSLIARMSNADEINYDKVKEVLLQEFKVNSAALLQRYQNTVKERDETYALYSTRLKTVLQYYIDSRKVTNLQSLIDLLVCDRIKAQLPDALLKHVLSAESTADGGYLKLKPLTSTLDAYTSTHFGENPKKIPAPLTVQSSAANHSAQSNFNQNSRPRYSGFNNRRYNHYGNDGNQRNFNTNWRRNGNAFNGQNHNGNSYNNRSTYQRPPANVNLSSIAPQSLPTDVNRPSAETSVKEHIVTPEAPISIHRAQIRTGENDYGYLSELQYIDVCVSNDDNDKIIVSSLCDTGAQLSVINASLVDKWNLKAIGSVQIRGLIGESVECNLVNIKLKLQDCNDDDKNISAVVAVMPDLHERFILCGSVVNQLLETRCNAISTVADSADECDDDVNDVDNANDDNDVNNAPDTSDLDNNVVDDSVVNDSSLRKASVQTLINEQRLDDSLKTCFVLAKKAKGGFFLRNDLLYHYGKLAGQTFEQLVLPLCRRSEVLKLAHETYGAHMGVCNTKWRILFSFYWPTIARDVKQYVSTCSVCARRKRVTVYDRTPIVPIERDSTAFNHWHCDALGPISSEKFKYQYCFVMIDQKTRFPLAFELTAYNAKNVVNCLLKAFSIFGVPQFISMDNATCHSAKIVKILLSKIGCTPIFITPTNSRGNGLAERCIGTLKELIHKVAVEKRHSWHIFLPHILWCLREIPQTSTGVPPWMLAFGFLPRGPCSILKETWCGEKEELPLDLSPSTADYLIKLREQLATANEYASEHIQKTQQQWAQRYNLRARPKSFQVGDQVLILSPDSTSSRLFARWKAPATVVECKSPFSYIVEYAGNRQVVPVSKLRHFDVRCDSVTVYNCALDNIVSVSAGTSVINDHDVEMGRIDYVDVPLSVDIKLPSQLIPESKLSHLSAQQCAQLLFLLDQYHDVFSDTPGLCNNYVHDIIVTDDFRPKRLKEYRIPEKLKGEVRRQIQELLQLGLIRESKSPMASPLICVLKGPQGRDGVRCVMDYRYLNKYTVSDALSPPDIPSAMQRIGKAKYISTFDGKSSYWTIPLKPECQWLTAFVCEGQTYEWTRASFGLKNSGSAFLRAIEKILAELREFVESFVDDMAVYTFTEWETHLNHIDKFLNKIKQSGLTLALKKSSFGQPEVKFCGFIVGSGQRRIDSSKLEAIMHLKRPETKQQVRSILGTFSWFRDYIPNFTDHSRLLIELTANRRPNRVVWTSELEHEFQCLKTSLCDAANNSLAIIDWSKPFNVSTDASDYAASGVLSQTDDLGRDCPIAFYSKKLSPSQKVWPIIEREAFAILEALNRFKTWVFGYKIIVYCDHNPLSYLTDTTPKSPRLLRWALALQSYDIEFHYKAGQSRRMAAPDCLSRLGPDEV